MKQFHRPRFVWQRSTVKITTNLLLVTILNQNSNGTPALSTSLVRPDGHTFNNLTLVLINETPDFFFCHTRNKYLPTAPLLKWTGLAVIVQNVILEPTLYNFFIINAMAIGLFKLSQNQRKTLAGAFFVLNIFEVILGATVTGTSIYVFVAISPMILTEKAEINFVFVVYALFGINVMFNWLIGIKICHKCINQAHKKSTRSLLLLWYCAGTNTVITLIIIANMSRKANKHIVKSMKNSIQGDQDFWAYKHKTHSIDQLTVGGMKTYLTDMESKENIDKIQYQMECCGFDSYKDWQDIEWMDGSIINTKASQVEELRFHPSKVYLPVVPWSCCKVDFPLQCLHDPLQQVAFTNVWVDEPNTVTDSLNTKGCVEKIKTPISLLIDGIVMAISAITILHVIIILISRILYTSCRNAILLYDLEGIAPGWIFGRGDCGYARGKTLTELMGITNEILEKRILEDKKKDKTKPKEPTIKKDKSDVSEHTASTKTTLFSGLKKKFSKKPEDELEKDVESAGESMVSKPNTEGLPDIEASKK